MDIKAMLLNRIDLEGLIIEDVLRGIVKKKLDELVADSSNTLDDALVAMIYPEIEKAAARELKELLDKFREEASQEA